MLLGKMMFLNAYDNCYASTVQNSRSHFRYLMSRLFKAPLFHLKEAGPSSPTFLVKRIVGLCQNLDQISGTQRLKLTK